MPQAPVAPACRPPPREPDWRTCRTAYERFAFAWPGEVLAKPGESWQ